MVGNSANAWTTGPAAWIRSRRGLIAAFPEGGVLAALLVVILIFSILQPDTFATVSNARNVITDASVLLVLAAAATFVIIAGGIDVSLGSVISFSQVVAVKAMVAVGGSGPEPILIGLVVAVSGGLAWGLINGLLIARLELPPLIATLATLAAALGAARLISGGVDIAGVPRDLIETVGIGRVMGVPYLVLIAAALTLVLVGVLGKTKFGRHTYAVGSNADAAFRAGVPVRAHLTRVYMLAGGLYGVAAFLTIARFGTTDITGNVNDVLDAITAVALGGVSLFGGVGTILGSAIGVFIPATLENGLIVVGLPSFWQQVAVGAALAAAVYADQIRRKRTGLGT